MPASTESDATPPSHPRRWLLLAAVVAVTAVAAVALALFQPWKLWVDDIVNEAAPAGAVPITAPPTTPRPPPTSAGSIAPATTPQTPPPTATVVAQASKPAPTTTASPTTTVAPVTTTVPPPAGGTFSGIDHATNGTVVLLQDAQGGQFVRLEDLDTSNGPDLFVYLSTNPPDGPEGQFDDDHVNLGRLQGNIGSSNYLIPPGTDLARYASVVIWCDRFNSAFGAAPLR
jgi:hypothetical protein